MSRIKLFLPLIAFVVVAVFFYVMVNKIDQGEYSPQDLPSALVNKPFPEFRLAKLEQLDTIVSQTDLHGQIALINVWATWCPSCHVEHGYLNYLSSEQGITIFGVNYKDKAHLAQEWLATKGNPYRLTIFDPEGRLGLDMGVTGAPETYVIDHRGFVRMRYQGPLSESVWQEKFQPLLDQLKAEQRGQASVEANVETSTKGITS